MGCGKVGVLMWLLFCAVVACGVTNGMTSLAPNSMSTGDIMPGAIFIWLVVFILMAAGTGIVAAAIYLIGGSDN